MRAIDIERGFAILTLLTTQACSNPQSTQTPEGTQPKLIIPTEVPPTPSEGQIALELLRNSKNWQSGDTVLIESNTLCGLNLAHRFPFGESHLVDIVESGAERLNLTWLDAQSQKDYERLEGYTGFSQAVALNLFDQNIGRLTNGISIGLGLGGSGVSYTVRFNEGDLMLTDGVTKKDYTKSFSGRLYSGAGGNWFDPEIVIRNGFLDTIDMSTCGGHPETVVTVQRSFTELIFHSSDMMSLFEWSLK